MMLKFCAFIAVLGLTACGEPTNTAGDKAKAAHGLEVISREVNSANGKALFVDKGCVVCHAVNGIGGKAAPALDAEIGSPAIDPLDFAARMWLGAPAMIELQSIELGYTIYLTADEIADIAAFAGDVQEQKTLSLDQVPETLQSGFLDEQFWEVEDWEGFLRSGQEDAGLDEPETLEPEEQP